MKLTKRLLLSTIAAISINSAVQAAPFNGPYIGVEAGYAAEKTNTHLVSAPLAIDATQKDNTASFNGGAFAGYGKKYGSFYLGGESHLDWNDLDRTKAYGTETVTQKHNVDVAADIRAGFLPTPSILLYGLVGAAYGKFEYSDVDPTLPIAAQSEKWLAGIRGGLGAETQLISNTTARLDWVYTQYQPATVDVTTGGVSIGRAKVSPTSNVIHLGVAYSF